MDGLIFIKDFIVNHNLLYHRLRDSIAWDARMAARKTASFGEPYDYSQIAYSYQPFPAVFGEILERITDVVGYSPNNCLLNYYADGKSKMGFHSDRVDNY